MLARVAENVYWLARYLERAENSARIVNVNTNLLLDLPPGIAPGWLPLVDISGNRELFDTRHRRADERDVVQFLIADTDNPGSIVSSLHSARENARTLRDVLPTSVWELLNEFSTRFRESVSAGIAKRARFAFLRDLIATLQSLAGMVEGTMNRNDAYTFMMLGRNLERADMTSRIVDVRSAQLLPQQTADLRPFETVQWMSVLKSLSGHQMYRLRMRTRVSRADVLAFLLRDQEFPRACHFCFMEAARALGGLPRSEAAQQLLSEARDFIALPDLRALDQSALHLLIDQIQLHVNGVHNSIAQLYFPAPQSGERAVISR
jgi:uncharacterized alpha-E superfamily protein